MFSEEGKRRLQELPMSWRLRGKEEEAGQNGDGKTS